MKYAPTLILVLLTLAGFTCPAIYAQTQDQFESAQSTLAVLETRLDSTLGQFNKLSDRARTLAIQITLLKTKSPLSNGEQKQLQSLMRKSLELEKTAFIYETDLKNLSQKREKQLKQLLLLAQRALNKQVKSKGHDKENLARIRKLIQQKNLWEDLLKTENTPIRTGGVINLNENDSPRTLHLKGDLLLDRRDGLLAEQARTLAQITRLKDEMELRTRLNELSQDIYLFNENDELIINNKTNAERGKPATNERLDLDTKAFRGSAPESYTPDYTVLDDFLNSPFPGTPAAMKNWIARLQKHQQEITQRADSLAQQAAIFHAKAKSSSKK